MSVLEVKVYQAVYLGTKQATFFTNAPGANGKPQFGQLTFELIPGVGVRVENETHNIIVPFPNVQYIRMEKGEQKKQKTKLTVNE
jgi:hypothetical protein